MTQMLSLAAEALISSPAPGSDARAVVAAYLNNVPWSSLAPLSLERVLVVAAKVRFSFVFVLCCECLLFLSFHCFTDV